MTERLTASVRRGGVEPAARTVLRLADDFSAVTGVVTLELRLREALERAVDADDLKPLVAALLGGTGVGKSKLFSALVGVSGVSPSSASVRCWTKTPFAAAARADRPLVGPALDSLGTVFVPLADHLSGLVLVDTPDVDGMLLENRAVARRVVDTADVVVYVVDKDKRANLDPLREIAEWADRKQWLFVLNKADLAGDDLDEVKNDFRRRIVDLGFTTARIFAVSADRPDEFEFGRLQAALRQRPSADARRALREAHRLRYVSHAVGLDVQQPLRRFVVELQTVEDALEEDVRRAYHRAWAAPAVSSSLQTLVRDRVWQLLAGRVGGPMALPLSMGARWSTFTSAMLLGRLTMGGMGVGALAALAGTTLWSAIRGTLALQRVASLLGTDFRRTMQQITLHARRTVDERGLGRLLPVLPEPAVDDPPSVTDAGSGSTVAQWTSAADRWLQSTMKPTADAGLINALQRDVERLAEDTTAAVARPAWSFFANLLPTLALLDVARRLGTAWIFEDYLPGVFYPMALGVFAVSLTPGLLIYNRLVRRRLRDL
ncbi:MAG: GTPase, partial [Planctomycetia bacterium]